ncbi:MAG: hypothetical protein OQL08_12650 [Gammaproteobacteria bacterium]|nr:hypothetical protein [Gammaproteobacteria bacterium]
MNYTALSLSQAPPLSVPLRFFLTAPLFLAAAALLFIFADPTLLSGRWSPLMLALTHLITLGFLATCMVGAVQQLLPVLIGTPFGSPRRVAALLHLPLVAGIALLVTGMGLTRPLLLQLGSALLLPALLLFILLTAHALWRTRSRHATVAAMGLALLGLLLLGAIALWVLPLSHWQPPLAHPYTRLHIGWGAVGWIGALLIGVAYQVVPMFQITPEYPPRVRRWLIPALALLLTGWSLSHDWLPILTPLLGHLLALLLALFAAQTLWLQEQRRRRLADVSLDFWRLAMLSLLLALLTWVAGQWLHWPRLELLTGALFLLGFATSAVNGMLYKIVPFLVWLHLNSRLQAQGRWQGGVPNMKQVILPGVTRWQLRLHLLALALLLLTLALPTTIPPWIAGGLWLANALFLWWNLLQGVRCYRRTLQAAQAVPV